MLNEILPYLNQQVTLYLETDLFSITLSGILKEYSGGGKKWITVEHSEPVKYLELKWDNLDIKVKYDDRFGVRIFLKEKSNENKES